MTSSPHPSPTAPGLARRSVLGAAVGAAAATSLGAGPTASAATSVPATEAPVLPAGGLPDEVEYVVIGSGPGGGSVAANLAEAGHSVTSWHWPPRANRCPPATSPPRSTWTSTPSRTWTAAPRALS